MAICPRCSTYPCGCPRPSLAAVVSAPADAARRDDAAKVRYDLVPHEWERQLALLLTLGARKYDDDNWQRSVGTPESAAWRRRCLASLRRHLAAWQAGEVHDPEHLPHEVHHMTAVAWNALAIMWYDERERKK